MSWHDNHVHALRIVEGEHGAGELQLDLDYILRWQPGEGNRFKFEIARATLRFFDVTSLRIHLDYAEPSAGLCPFSLHSIDRRVETRPKYDANVWTLRINWPVGEISFEASGYRQDLTGAAVVTDKQWLEPNERACGA